MSPGFLSRENTGGLGKYQRRLEKSKSFLCAFSLIDGWTSTLSGETEEVLKEEKLRLPTDCVPDTEETVSRTRLEAVCPHPTHVSTGTELLLSPGHNCLFNMNVISGLETTSVDA